MFLLGLLVILFMAIINAVPLAFFTMLFLGNIGLHLSFLAILPGALAAKCLWTNLVSAPAAASK